MDTPNHLYKILRDTIYRQQSSEIRKEGPSKVLSPQQSSTIFLRACGSAVRSGILAPECGILAGQRGRTGDGIRKDAGDVLNDSDFGAVGAAREKQAHRGPGWKALLDQASRFSRMWNVLQSLVRGHTRTRFNYNRLEVPSFRGMPIVLALSVCELDGGQGLFTAIPSELVSCGCSSGSSCGCSRWPCPNEGRWF